MHLVLAHLIEYHARDEVLNQLPDYSPVVGSPPDYSPVDVNNVVLPTCWALGAADALAALTNHIPTEHINYAQLANDGMDMMRPHGEWVGVKPTELDDVGDAGGAGCSNEQPEGQQQEHGNEEGFSLEDMLDEDDVPIDSPGALAPVQQSGIAAGARAVVRSFTNFSARHRLKLIVLQ